MLSGILGQPPSSFHFFSDAPFCKPDQRTIYGTARKTETQIACHVDANPFPHAFRWQFKTANGKEGRGHFINNHNLGNEEAIDQIKNMVDLPSNQYIIQNDASVLTYKAMTGADYGYLYCWAENVVGKQTEPCIFEVSVKAFLIFQRS